MNVWRHPCWLQIGGCWHLMARGQGCPYTSYDAQHPLLPKRTTWPHVSRVPTLGNAAGGLQSSGVTLLLAHHTGRKEDIWGDLGKNERIRGRKLQEALSCPPLQVPCRAVHQSLPTAWLSLRAGTGGGTLPGQTGSFWGGVCMGDQEGVRGSACGHSQSWGVRPHRPL